MSTGDGELPREGGARARWVAEAAGDASEVKARYDAWAGTYDRDVAASIGWCAPERAAALAADLVAKEASILDAGAGTGLLGEALNLRGFEDLVAADLSFEMLSAARAKGVYRSLVEVDLTRPLPFADGAFDAVASVGTSGYLDGTALRELARIVRRGGHVLFLAGDTTYRARGFESVQQDLERTGRLELAVSGPAFAAVPRQNPDQRSRVRAFRRP